MLRPQLSWILVAALSGPFYYSPSAGGMTAALAFVIVTPQVQRRHHLPAGPRASGRPAANNKRSTPGAERRVLRTTRTTNHGLYGVASSNVLSSSSSSSSPSVLIMSFVYMTLLALQFAFQPILTKAYAPSNISKSTYVLAQEMIRLSIALTLLLTTGGWTVATRDWTWTAALASVGIPSLLYLLQNFCSLSAYQTLQPITYNVLNQTKTLSAAVCCYLLIGLKQSKLQILALLILLLSALVIESVVELPSFLFFWRKTSDPNDKDTNSVATTASKESLLTSSSSTDSKEEEEEDDSIVEKNGTTSSSAVHRNYILFGIIPVLVASMTSGMAGAWTQRSLRSRNALLFSVELGTLSLTILLIKSAIQWTMSRDEDEEQWTLSNKRPGRGTPWRQGWTWQTWIPVLTNASGGILVGLVTKYAGAVRKGFALIFGMFLSGFLQNIWASRISDGENGNNKDEGPATPRQVTAQQWVGGFLAAVSLWMHSNFPVQPR